jgi:hypothetical protein
LRPVPVDILNQHIFRCISDFLDEFETLDSVARKSAGVDPSGSVPSIPSPFTTQEGQDKWAALLAPPKEEIVDPKAKKAPPPKDKGKDKGGAMGPGGTILILQPFDSKRQTSN